MEKLALPDKYNVEKTGTNQAKITIEPCYPGYGTTVGNALRRVLLSSLPGAAITSVKFNGATHEFSTLPGVKEDIVEIILNLKKICFKLHNTDEAVVSLKVKGAKKIKAKDIKLTSDIEVTNPNAEIATLNDKSAEVEMELTVKSGRGYVPVENKETLKFSLGTIAIDSIFTPVKNVNYSVENVRVGQMTNYDRIILNILTDGTMSPEEALKKSASLLVDHFSQIVGFETTPATKASKTQSSKKEDLDGLAKAEKSVKKTVKEEAEKEEKPKKKRGRSKKE